MTTEHQPYQVTAANFMKWAGCLPDEMPQWVKDAIESELIRYNIYINRPHGPIKSIWLEFRQSGSDKYTEVPEGAYLTLGTDDKIRWTQRP